MPYLATMVMSWGKGSFTEMRAEQMNLQCRISFRRSALKRVFLPVLFMSLLLNFSFINYTLADDIAEGKALIKAKGCIQCHGLSGNKGFETSPPVPKLAGQPVAYLIKSMTDYKLDIRKDNTMNLLMKPRTETEIEKIAKYYSAQKRY